MINLWRRRIRLGDADPLELIAAALVFVGGSLCCIAFVGFYALVVITRVVTHQWVWLAEVIR